MDNIAELAGRVVSGRYKRAGRPSTPVVFEVTGVVRVPSRFGYRAYLLGTRLNGDQAGAVQLLRVEGFRPKDLEAAEPAQEFEPVDPEGYYVNPFGGVVFSFLEKVEDEDVERALEEGCIPLSELLVAAE